MIKIRPPAPKIRIPARRSDLGTSHVAGERYIEETEERWAMLEAFSLGPNTDRGAARIATPPGKHFESYRKRGSDLTNMGYLRLTGEKMLDPETNRKGMVREITLAGLRALRNR